jgi:hypothetical protein
MNPGGLSGRALLELLADLLDRRLRDAAPAPARLTLFPKRVHELGPGDGPAPDGLSPDYVRLAAALNAGAPAPAGEAAGTRVLTAIEQVVATAAVHERALVALLQRS